MMGVGVAGCRIYGAVCDAMCAIAASEMVWVEQNGLILRTLGTNFEKLPCGGLQNDVPRMRQRSVEIRRSKCKSYVVLRGAILEQ